MNFELEIRRYVQMEMGYAFTKTEKSELYVSNAVIRMIEIDDDFAPELDKQIHNFVDHPDSRTVSGNVEYITFDFKDIEESVYICKNIYNVLFVMFEFEKEVGGLQLS